ncbi:helix-turn-helix transcriptional regulator [Phytohabitans suffuscus]|uniref:AraC family transcriptional regulator n=1 Tax=Phytohabitans suffuscus TaxID=624315 RepID=A0A6F8YFU2_9ACTN|nr:helix-turn-helix transcriptional regulator [Phytohabitans suffuscus]BCB84848.1 AraC family transcriptional regulator [Phytohabitans suffuscus]
MAPGVYRRLGRADGFHLYDMRCLVDHPGWLGPKPESGFRVVLARSGAYLRRVNGRETFVDATSVLLMRPGDELSVAHPLGCGDVFTGLDVTAELLAARADCRLWLDRRGWEGTVGDRVDLRHRALVAACRRGIDGFETAERVHHLMAELLAASGQPGDDVVRAVRRRPATLAAHRRLADQTRAALAAGLFHAGLRDLASTVNSSPHHLSRVFHTVVGQSLTAYRNRMRVRAVLHDLDQGVSSLRTLAHRYGFADQSHLTRVVRQHLGESPSTCVKLLRRDGGPPTRT